jgi:hypothetical protein
MMKLSVLVFLIVLLAGCGRDMSKMENAILGHWTTKDMYISSNQVIFFDQAANIKEMFDYKIQRISEPKKENKNYENAFGFIELY